MSISTGIRILPTEDAIIGWNPKSNRTIEFDGQEHTFDHVFSNQKNVEIFDICGRLIVERVVDGYNGTIAAYGQSGTGKTYSLLGTDTEQGLMKLAVNHLLHLIKERISVQYLVKMSAFEIYKENLVDLLDDKSLKDCRIVGDVVVGAVEEVVESYDHFLRVCQKAQERRSVGETKLNQKSSRSHAVFQLVVESCQIDVTTNKPSTTVSKLIVLDLAGSENARTMTNATQTAESRMINLSLLALSRIVSDLAKNPASKCLSFRDSLLTRILKPVLGGNSQFLLLCCIRKIASSETASTISFGQNAKKMPNHVKKNVGTGEAALPALIAQISELKRQLEEKEAAEQDKNRLEDLLKKVLNSEPAVGKPTAPVPKRRHSIAIGGHVAPVSMQRFSLGQTLEEDFELDSGRSSRASGICSLISIEERPISPEVSVSKETQTDIALVDKSVHDGMIRYETSLHGKIADLEEQLEQEKKAFDEKARECKEFVRQLSQKDKEYSEKETSLKQKVADAESKYENLKARELAILQEKNILMKDREHYLEKNTLLLKEQLEKEKYAFHDKMTELENLVKKIARKDEQHAKTERKLMQKAIDTELKYTDLKKRGVAMLEEKNVLIKNQEHEISRKTEELDCSRKEFLACDIERRALLDQQEQKFIGVRSQPSCSDPDHAMLAFKVRNLICQRELLISSLYEYRRSVDQAAEQ